jgi:ABC-type sugar transport system ATPase subunit
MQLTIRDLHKRFDEVEALRGVDFAAEQGEFFAVLGPSGAGKTTLLRIIAGIERADHGAILLDGRNVADIPVRARDTAMVFQTFALYPHLSTFENLAYPLREARLSSEEISRRVGEIAEMLRLTPHAQAQTRDPQRWRAAALRDRARPHSPAEAPPARRAPDQSRRQTAPRHARRI